jgi:hypothetical protein
MGYPSDQGMMKPINRLSSEPHQETNMRDPAATARPSPSNLPAPFVRPDLGPRARTT